MTDIALPSRAQDTPRSAYRALERRVTVGTVGVLLALAGLGWWLTVAQSDEMTGMVSGLADVGSAMPFDMSAGVFMSMWVTMMVAMMFPTVAPIVLLHRMVVRRRGQGVTPTVAFGSGYLLVWTAVGLIPLAALLGFRHVADGSTWVLRLGGGVLVVAGLYQFTRWKDTCIRACRSPLTFLATHDFGRGLPGAVRAGIAHGAYCFGCCWALMAVLFVVGLMNFVWMALIAAVFLAEKNWRYGVGLTKVVGTALVVFGLVVLVHPAALGSIGQSSDSSSMTSMS